MIELQLQGVWKARVLGCQTLTFSPKHSSGRQGQWSGAVGNCSRLIRATGEGPKRQEGDCHSNCLALSGAPLWGSLAGI